MTYGGRLEAFITVPTSTTVAATCTGQTATSVSLTAGSYTPTTYCAHLATRLNAAAPRTGGGTWTVTLSTGTSGTGLVTIALGGNTFTVAWTTAAAGTVLGFAASATNASPTGTTNARGLWLPDCPLDLDGDPDTAYQSTDSRSTESPSGSVITLGGQSKYVHENLRWSHLTRARVREGSATTTYASLEQWFNDTQYGAGHTWFSRGSAFQVYWDNAGTDRILGYDLNSGAGPTAGWNLSPAIPAFKPRKAAEGWLGMWSFAFPRIVTAG